MELNKYDNIEQVLETIGEEVKSLSKDEFNDEENSYYENLYKKSEMSFKEIANLYGYKSQKYEDFCKTPEAEEYALDEEDVKYYKEKFANGKFKP